MLHQTDVSFISFSSANVSWEFIPAAPPVAAAAAAARGGLRANSESQHETKHLAFYRAVLSSGYIIGPRGINQGGSYETSLFSIADKAVQ